ncbi:uncharacterized protein STEHIDRAFT_47129 [Stereum hirsutum FP-91666 SS1]|uniref:uncharacterized protein n=1 Tax=Stereum hirsutum (strain FP-91666) TaxID=721885 RepID=UPI0004409FEA|nr:uncharacterized protein STEHIDRAFT_47129 [Stereum hirsutum FP-91666 SS1]EIM92983.1 hypothetical protein STEHIDRAFT_47129 [Stereum hirsutum FP-91666 SS1]
MRSRTQLPCLAFTVSSFFASFSHVLAHGYVGQVTIDGTVYNGNAPGETANASPIRQISSNGPVKGASNPDLNCGLDAQLASEVADANSGSTVVFQWTDGPDNWPHEVGPLMTYMAMCEDTTCDQYNSTNAAWFKIDQVGLKSDDSTWYQAEIMQGKSFSVSLPDNLAPGDYLIRHEIIALHLADSEGGAEFYPSCTQVRIGGSGTGTPDSTVAFPGAYNDDDPGIYDPTIFNGNQIYIFPGPDISNLAATADQSTEEGGQAPSGILENGQTVTATGSAIASSAATTSSGSSSSTGSGSDSGSSGTSSTSSNVAKCNLKKRDTATLAKRGAAKHRSHWSKILRSWIRHS